MGRSCYGRKDDLRNRSCYGREHVESVLSYEIMTGRLKTEGLDILF